MRELSSYLEGKMRGVSPDLSRWAAAYAQQYTYALFNKDVTISNYYKMNKIHSAYGFSHKMQGYHIIFSSLMSDISDAQ